MCPYPQPQHCPAGGSGCALGLEATALTLGLHHCLLALPAAGRAL